uniref:Uncharacterized protein LOC113794361 n=1 Tax=Dermatophagoides pteronyssinus TaxID=6956 RepID=A0A6P6Y5J8_DERPT|nr:uncharacterized protein LOC113794361 [Dermatophagoides pteronyssinus]
MTISIIPKSLKNISFVEIFQRNLIYLQIFTFRLKFSLEDYQNKNIPLTWKTFRITFMLTSMTLTAIFCLGLLTLFPKNHPFMSFHNIETILKTDRMDLFTMALFIMVITLEAMFFHLSSEVLNYRMIAYRLYIINGIATIAIGYYWAIIFYEENIITLKESVLSMLAFGLIITDIAYLVGQMFTTILLFIVFVIELFQVKLEELYKFVRKMFDHYWTYNRMKTIFWDRFQAKYVKLYAEIVDFNNSFDVMLFYIETVSKSSIIISCMFYSKQKEISQYCIMVILSLMSTFICVTILYSRVARLPSYNRRCYYQNKNIPWTWKTFRYTFLLTPMTLFSIIFLGILAIWPDNHPFMDYHVVETILKTERMDLFILALFIMSIILEAIFRLYIINCICTIVLAYYWSIIFYTKNLTTFRQLVFTFPAYFVACWNLTYLIGQLLLTVLTFIVFVIEFFQVKFEELDKLAKKVSNRHWTKNEFMKIFWSRFQVEYVKLYAEISDFNKSFSVMLLYMETVSKSSIIISCMFYSKQKEIGEYFMVAILSLMSTFVCVTSLYSRVARLPSHNRRCCKSIIKWLARTQWSSSKTKFKNTITRQGIIIINRTTIKSNLFVQTMSENQLGFTCGHLFFITKFKYIELLLMNIPMIFMFYEQLCMDS